MRQTLPGRTESPHGHPAPPDTDAPQPSPAHHWNRRRPVGRTLAGGATANATARAVGYRKPSSFISAFRRATGQTPGTYTPGDTAPPSTGR
ncbi:hypothetical protein AB1484_34085 [Parafrankia sp. FMc6]|uniref:hypothetical protein n=1 Tax=Parafrankia soli TaxID=2599596 RepID=UPI0034D61E90